MSAATSLLRWAWAPLYRRASEYYVAGPDIGDALAVARELGRHGIPTTIGYFDPDGEPPERVAATLLTAIDAVAESRLDCYLSIKAPSLGFDAELIGRVLGRGAARGVHVHYDAMTHDTVERTLALLDAGGPGAPQPGFTLPGGWRRSPADAAVVAARGLRVRVVKGQYRDPDGRTDLRAGYMAVIEKLAGTPCTVAVATHDPVLARQAIDRLLAAGTRCELELLYALSARQVLGATRGLGVPVRYYVPWGTGSLTFPLWRAGELRLLRALVGDLAGRRQRFDAGIYAAGLATSGETAPGASPSRRTVP